MLPGRSTSARGTAATDLPGCSRAQARAPEYHARSPHLEDATKQVATKYAPCPLRRDSHVGHFKISSEASLNKRTSELNTRKMYLTNFWYAATFSRELSVTKAYRTKLLDTEVMLWRDEVNAAVICVSAVSPITGQPIQDDQVTVTTYLGDDEQVKSAMCAPSAKPIMMCADIPVPHSRTSESHRHKQTPHFFNFMLSCQRSREDASYGLCMQLQASGA